MESCAERRFPNQLELGDCIYQGSFASLEWFIMKSFTYSKCSVAAIIKLLIFYLGIL